MSLTVFLIVLFAAVLHAVWNSLVKGDGDKKVAMTSVVLGHVPIAVLALPFVPLPAVESWPFIAVSACIHVAYQIFLLNAYRFGDLTHVYPVARGVAPLLVAVASVMVLGKVLSLVEGVAVLLIATGIISLALVRGPQNTAAFWLALATGVMIAAYSITDGLGARLAGTPLGYYAWQSILNAALTLGYMRITCPRGQRFLRINGKVAALGGGASFLAYALVIWAFTQAPIALVTALRETSIIFALLIGVFVFRERLSLSKLLAICVTLGGAALLRLGG